MKLTIKHKKETSMLTMYESVRNVMIVLKDVEEKGLTFKGVVENEFVEVEVDTELPSIYELLFNQKEEAEDEQQ